jgi:hypothetical protein
MSNGETFLSLILKGDDLLLMVADMRTQGYNVEKTPLGYVCHEVTRFGQALVLSAIKGKERYRVKVNVAFFDCGVVQTSTVQ